MTNREEEKMRISVYYLSNFKKYTRKIYGFGELKLPRPIRVNVFITLIIAWATALILRFVPPFSYLAGYIPDYMLFIVLPAVVAYLLSEFREEDRTFYQYMKSSIKYGIRKRQNKAYYRGEEIEERVRQERVK